MEARAEDFELLGRYAQNRDQAAFAQIVKRYLNMVYSAAIRRVGNRELAEDVAQATFIVLARKAGSLYSRRPSLSAWMLTTVRYAAANALKMENRRQNREQAAVRQRSAVASSNPTDVLIWHEVSQHLDDAVLRLSLADRKMILLRFYEQHALPEIAAELGLTENAARQRLSRALRKLRDRLTKKSALASALDCGAFAGLLGEQLIRAAPPAIGKAACAAAAGAGAGTGFTLAKGAMHMMTLAKTKVAVAAVAVVTLTGIGGMMAIRSAPAQDQPAAAPAPPPAPAAASDDPFSLVNAPPVVVKTVPESGIDDVDPGLTEIRVTYSKEMKDGSWSWSTWGEKTFPKLSGKPHYLDGKRTCVLPVKLEPNKTYATWLNSDRFLGFKDAGGRPAVPYLLIFKTRP